MMFLTSNLIALFILASCAPTSSGAALRGSPILKSAEEESKVFAEEEFHPKTKVDNNIIIFDMEVFDPMSGSGKRHNKSSMKM